MKGVTGEEMLGLLERRLDNVVYRMGFAATRAQGAPAGATQPRAGQRQAREHPELPRARPRTRSRSARRAARSASSRLRWRRPTTVRVRPGSRSTRTNFSGVFKSMPVRDELNEPMVREQLRRRVLLEVIFRDRYRGQLAARDAGRPRGVTRGAGSPHARDGRANPRYQERQHMVTQMMSRNWRELIRPKAIHLDPDSATDFYGKFTCEPLERGFGITRRQLAAARAAVVAAGRGHHRRRVSTARCTSSRRSPTWSRTSPTSSSTSRRSCSRRENPKTYTVRLEKEGPGLVTAGDIQVVDGLESAQPRPSVATLDKKGPLSMELTVNVGRGYVPADRNKSPRCRSARSRSTRCSRRSAR